MSAARRALLAALTPLLVLVVWAAPARAADFQVTSPAQGEDATPAVTGLGEVGTTVTISLDGTELCAAEVAADESWTCTVEDPLPLGEQVTLDVVVTTPADEVVLTEQTLYYTYPARPELRITSPVDGATISGSPRVLGRTTPLQNVDARLYVDGVAVPDSGLSDDGEGGWVIPDHVLRLDGPSRQVTLQVRGEDGFGRPVESNAVRVALDVDAPAKPTFTSPVEGRRYSAWPTFSGDGEPGSRVQVIFGGSGDPVTQEVVVGADGRWTAPLRTFRPDRGGDPLPRILARSPIDVQFVAEARDAVGNESASLVTVTFARPAAATTPAAEATPTRPTTPPAAPVAELANTGPEDAGAGGLLGGSLVALGGVLVLWARRSAAGPRRH